MIEPPKNPDERAQKLLPPGFDPAYVEGAVKPFLLSGIYQGDVPSVPMIDLAFSKEKAIPAHIWGMLYDGWLPNMEEDGLSVFLQGYENRGPENERKKIYFSALTPDLYEPMYAARIRGFFDRLFDPANESKPLMHQYYQGYFDLYWDLHLGVSGEAVPAEVRQFGTSFNAVIGFWFPTLEVVYENYMQVRKLRQPLKDWVDARVQDILDGKVPEPGKTFVHYWLKNGGMGETFRRKDIVFECFHNFLAFSQWGNTFYNIMARLSGDRGDEAVRSWFERTMSGRPDETDGGAFTPLDRFAMELMRVISPNGGSFSSLTTRQGFLGSGYAGILHPHPDASRDPRHWPDPDAFNPDRYKDAPTSDQTDDERARRMGLARCPFGRHGFAVKDGRDAQIANSGFGAVHGVVDGRTQPVCDSAGYAPFGFGYRRCAGEFLTIFAIKDFLRTVWREKIAFSHLQLDRAEMLPVGPGTVVQDDIGFRRG
ncbi:hypothetical protein [Azospirillum thermophilum]|uniref:Cytochrome P450 n=1 Tax=Azospirillum thermophilum TaxID=2202148 RepID=A0A2S2CMR7_9PROT|nr:hypothetical protein [Azospirillum thermophilum]AWK85670.1 hypothetical protein DEW08_05385 [Azospirillum thermophilum]